jgi:hypothetical protein
VVGDPLIGTAEHQDLDELVEDDPVGDALPVAAQRVGVVAFGEQRGDLVPDGFDRPRWQGRHGGKLLAEQLQLPGAGHRLGAVGRAELELLLAHPVSRTRLVLQRFAALTATCAWLGLVVWAGTLAALRVADLDVGVGPVTATTAGLVLLALGFGALALAAGALTAHRGPVLGVTAALAVGAYLAHTVGSQVDALRPVQRLSPFWWYLGGDPLRTGLDPGHLALLAAVPLVLLGVALWSLNHRDVAV